MNARPWLQRILVLVSAFFVALFVAAPAQTADKDNPGQASLDKAIDKKLDAEKYEELAEVIKLAEQAIKEGLDEPNTAFAKNLLAGTYNQRGLTLAEMTLQAAQRDPTRPQWQQLRAGALTDLEKVVEIDPSAAEAQFAIARLQLLPAGKKDRAKTAIDKAIELSGGNAQLQAKALLTRVDLTEDADAQQADLDKAVKLMPKEKEYIRARGIFNLLRSGKKEDDKTKQEARLKAALSDFDASLKLDEADDATEHLRGLTLMELDQAEEADKAFTHALELNGKNPQTRVQRARARIALKKYEGAIEDLNIGLEREPSNPALLLLRARVLQMLNKTAEAQKDVEAALAKRPGMPEGLHLRALLASSSGDYARAIADCEDILKLAPDNTQLLMQIGLLHSAAKQPRKAIERYTAALEKLKDKDDKESEKEKYAALRSRGDAYLGVGKHAEAIADFEAAMKVKPRDPGLLNNLAWVLATSPDDKLRDGKRAVELAKGACEETEYKAPHILSTLAASYAEAGNWDEAQKTIAKALELKPNEEHLDQLQKEQKTYEKKEPWRELQNEPDAETPKNRVSVGVGEK
jgi:tetratricopeptide (TPR) repeat protein